MTVGSRHRTTLGCRFDSTVDRFDGPVDGVLFGLALVLWVCLELDRLWEKRLRPNRMGMRWLTVPKSLVCYRLSDPGNEWRLHRRCHDQSTLCDLLGGTERWPTVISRTAAAGRPAV